MHYGRGGSVGDASSTIAGGSPSPLRSRGSVGSSPDFAGPYESEYADSPPDTSAAHRQIAAAGAAYQHHPTAYAHTPPSLEMTYANGQMIHSGATGSYYPQPTYTNPAAGTHEAAGYAHSGASYAYYEEEKPNTRDYASPNTARAYGPGPTTWGPSYGGGYSSSASSRPPRHSDSPPLSPIDTRSASYFPTTGRDFPLSAVTSSSAASGNVPSSPTTPSSLSDSPSTPFSPQYASPYTHSHSHSHSHSASSTASASAYIQGTPLPPLQLNNPSAGGHFVPPSGGDYAVPAAPSPYSTTQGYGRSSPPEQTRLPPPAPHVQPSGPTSVATAPHQQPNSFAGPGYAARPFLCDDCGMNFARTHDLKRHQTTHVAGVKKTHPCPYCGKNLSRRDAIKRHVVSKQCPVAADKPHLTWPPPADHVPPPPDTVIERTTHRRGENPYPVLSSNNATASDRSHSGGYSSSHYSSTSPTSPGSGAAHFSASTYSPYGAGTPGAQTLQPPAGYDGGGVVFEYDHRSSAYTKGR